MNNAALAEPMFCKQMLHDMVVTVCVNADVACMREAELEQGLHYAMRCRCACDAVNNVV